MSLAPADPSAAPPSTTRERARAIALRILREQGELAGAQRIRDELGYGSLQTINAALRELRREWALRLERSLSLPELPGALAADASAWLQTLWQRALEQAEQNYAAQRAAAAAECTQLRAERDAMVQTLAAAQQATRQAVAERQRADRLIAEQEQALQQLRAEREQLRQQREEEREAAAQRQREADEALRMLREQAEQQRSQDATRLALLHDELQAQQAQHEQQQAQALQARQREQREAAAQRELLQHKLAAQGQALALAEQRALSQHEQLEQMRQQLETARQQGDALQQQRAAAQVALAPLQAERDQLAAERDEARRLLEALLQRLAPVNAAGQTE